MLNVDKDHKEIETLMEILAEFRNNTRQIFIVNLAQAGSRQLSLNAEQDFSADPSFPAGYQASGFKQQGLVISFEVNGVEFILNTVGKHNMENALAATAVANQLGVDLNICAETLKSYEGIYRRHQVL